MGVRRERGDQPGALAQHVDLGVAGRLDLDDYVRALPQLARLADQTGARRLVGRVREVRGGRADRLDPDLDAPLGKLLDGVGNDRDSQLAGRDLAGHTDDHSRLLREGGMLGARAVT